MHLQAESQFISPLCCWPLQGTVPPSLVSFANTNCKQQPFFSWTLSPPPPSSFPLSSSPPLFLPYSRLLGFINFVCFSILPPSPKHVIVFKLIVSCFGHLHGLWGGGGAEYECVKINNTCWDCRSIEFNDSSKRKKLYYWLPCRHDSDQKVGYGLSS